MRISPRRAALAATIALLAVAPAARADTFTWTGLGDGHTWSDPENWDQRRAPPNGPTTTAVVNGITSVTDADAAIGELQVTAGATVRGSNFTANRLVMLCGRVGFEQLNALGGEVAGGVIEGTLSVLGSIVQRRATLADCSPTDGGMDTPYTSVSSGAELIILGVWRSSIGSYLLGSNCCGTLTSSAVTVQSTGSLIGDAPGGISVVNAMFRVRGRLYGKIGIDGSRTTFESGAAPSGRGIRPGAVVRLVGGESASIAGRLAIHDGGVLDLVDAPNQLWGPGTIERSPVAGQRPATLRLTGGQVRDAITTGVGVRVEKTGAGRTWIRTLGGVPTSLTVLGPTALAGPGGLDVDGLAEVDLRGATTVTGGVDVRGTSCCRITEIPTLRISGTTTIGRGAKLTVTSASLLLNGRTAGQGELALLRGVHVLGRDSTLGSSTTTLAGNAEVGLFAGALRVDSAVEQLDADVEGPQRTGAGAGLATLSGRGSWAWRSGDIRAEVQLDIPLTASGVATDRVVAGRLATTRSALFAGRLTLDPGSVLRLEGATRFQKLDASTSGTPRALVRVRPDATLRLTGAGPAAVSSLAGVGLEVGGAVELDDRSLSVGSGVVTITTGIVRLQGGTLIALKTFVRPDGRLVGPGVVRGDVENAGTVRLARRGTLDVRGSWESKRQARLELARTGGVADILDVDGGFKADGRLVLSGFVRPPARRPPTLVRAGAVTGAFDRIAGLPARARVFYAARAIRLGRIA